MVKHLGSFNGIWVVWGLSALAILVFFLRLPWIGTGVSMMAYGFSLWLSGRREPIQ